ncbi:MAG: hypothetical protein EBR82_36150 [Caulobacteraceae bacterium]|nr:hypothetical protein [Caulobacteraceae bacterium]
MAVVTKTSPTFSTLISAQLVSTGNIVAAGSLLDLRTVPGAYITAFIGRQSGTPTRSAYFAIRPTNNNSDVVPATIFDVVGQGPTTACSATTINQTGGLSTSANTVTVAAAGSLAIGDTICVFNSGGTAVQWNRISGGSGTSWTVERNWRVANANGDNFTNLADVRKIWIPGGDQYEFRFINQSSIGYVCQLFAQVDNGETII